jgi:molybdopterin-guanine dinucleotide biosynthesis protein A
MTGIILAGGQSRRMGKDKAQLPWKEGTLLTATVDKLSLLCSEVVVVGPRRELPRIVHWTADRYIGKGPLAGLHAGLEAATCSCALVLPCDMPAVPVRVLEELVRLSKEVDMVIPVHSQGNEPLCAWYSIDACLPVIITLLEAGYSSLRDILPRVRVEYLEVEKIFPQVAIDKVFSNLNSPIDYEAAKQEATKTFVVS